MHKIVKVTHKGYIICKDNRTHLEKDTVGVLTAFYHSGRFVKCTDDDIKYSKKVCRDLFVRRIKNIKASL